MNEKKNLLWIDLAKGLCVLSVYFVHTASYCGYSISKVANYIHPFYVNAFFFISGYLLFRKQFSSSIITKPIAEYVKTDVTIFLKNLLFRMVLPSIVFSSAIFFPSFLLRNKQVSVVDFLVKTIGGCTYWYVSALVVAELLILVLLLLRCRNFPIYFIISSVLAILGYRLCESDFTLLNSYSCFPWQYMQGFEAMIFLVSGGMYWKYEKYIEKYLSTRYCFPIFLLFYFLAFTIWPDRIKVLISTNEINAVGIIMGIYASVLLVSVCKCIRKNPFLEYLGKNSLVFYFLSGALPIILSTIIGRLIPTNNLLGLIIVFMFSILGAWFASYIIKRYFSWLLDLRRITSILKKPMKMFQREAK